MQTIQYKIQQPTSGMRNTQFKEQAWTWPCWLDNAAGETLPACYTCIVLPANPLCPPCLHATLAIGSLPMPCPTSFAHSPPSLPAHLCARYTLSPFDCLPSYMPSTPCPTSLRCLLGCLSYNTCLDALLSPAPLHPLALPFFSAFTGFLVASLTACLPLRHYDCYPVWAVSYALCVSSQALPLLSSLCSLLCPMCFLPGTTITLQSVLCTIPCVSSQALPLLSSLCCLLCPVCFLPGTTITLQSVLFTMPCVLPPRHYHYNRGCAICYTLCASSQAPPLHCHPAMWCTCL